MVWAVRARTRTTHKDKEAPRKIVGPLSCFLLYCWFEAGRGIFRCPGGPAFSLTGVANYQVLLFRTEGRRWSWNGVSFLPTLPGSSNWECCFYTHEVPCISNRRRICAKSRFRGFGAFMHKSYVLFTNRASASKKGHIQRQRLSRRIWKDLRIIRKIALARSYHMEEEGRGGFLFGCLCTNS